MTIRILLLLTLAFTSMLSSVVVAQNANFYLQHFIKYQADTTESIGVFVKGTPYDATNFTEEVKGIYRGSINGWQFIRIPGSAVETLVKDSRFGTVNYRPYPGKTMNDTMRVNNRVNAVQQGLSPLDTSYTGQGVLVGLIDTGIDFLHPDFRTADDKTRILHLWDQAAGTNATAPAGYGYGRSWDSTAINAGSSTHTDPWGHGTTVSGAAVGNALANGTHKGVAPDAHIIMVESKFNASDWLSTVVDAVEYIYTQADFYDMPCVINASVGTYLGSHDGLDPYALYVDSLINQKRGRLFVASAGNSGDWEKYHLHVDQTADTSFTWFEYNVGGFGGGSCFWELWADTLDFQNLQYSIGADQIIGSHSFRGKTLDYNVSANLNNLLVDSIKNTNGDLIAEVQMWAEARDGQYLVQVYIPQPDSTDYLYRFETYGTGAYDIWSVENYGMGQLIDTIPVTVPMSALTKYTYPDSLQSVVSSFQCSPHVITVGNYSNDSGYVNKFNNWIPNDVARGVLHHSSSKGPSRLGALKPEICASGDNSLSAAPLVRINDWTTNGIDSVLAYGGMHMSNGGTSMASPIVGGVGALLLEKCATMNQAEFRAAILNTTYTDSHTGASLPNNAWGFGKLDAFAAVTYTLFSPSYTGDEVFCDLDSTQINIPMTYASVTWENGDTLFSQVYSNSDTTYFTVMDSAGCASDTLMVEIFEHDIPLIDPIIAPYSHCENDSAQVNITGVNINTVIWNDANTALTRFVVGNQTYFLNAIDTIGCKSDTVFIQVIENLNPATPIISESYDSLIATGGYAQYYWEFNSDSLTTIISDSVITITQNGIYQVQVMDINGCWSDFESINYSSVGLDELGLSQLIIYPNPTKGTIQILSETKINNIQLLNSAGAVIASNLISPINIGKYADGVYFIQVSTIEGIVVHKIVLNK
ncbi:MAG: subtilisin family serine protease [Flavobacteriales bacterium]|jgi:subtilisin family serine protease